MIVGKDLKSEFAPPERLRREFAIKQHEEISSDKKLKLFYDLTPDFVLVLNEYRQVIFANKTLLKFLNKSNADGIISLRPGEIFNCCGANKETGGCGTSKLCGECGAVKAILHSNYVEAEIEECCIITRDGITYNFRIWALRPWEGKDYVLIIMRDIADEKFRSSLEQTFFHDLTNTATDIQGLVTLIDSPENYERYSPLLNKASKELIDEISGQRDLRYAEEGKILIQKSKINALDLLNGFIELYKTQKISEGVKLIISKNSENITFQSDERLILRVIENMIKNAIEACPSGKAVTVKCRKVDNNVEFSVHNPGLIDKKVQLNIFKRSFSTKDKGRGWGTYSMKLLSEIYLKGKVRFTSSPLDGTTFYAEYPIEDT